MKEFIKNFLLALFVSFTLSFIGCCLMNATYTLLTGTTTTVAAEIDLPGFVEIDSYTYEGFLCHTVYAKDTKVMYFVVEEDAGLEIGPLYNSDGTLQVYKE